ncbi:MAG TPA: hypothetical protein VMI75_03465, partial [Polyangiaceae bacterium]|nr:hypothetical protein [Polyangiaceae bacterium]
MRALVTRRILVTLLASTGLLVSATPPAHADGPFRPSSAQEAVVRAGDRAADTLTGEPMHVRVGNADMYLPTFFHAVDGAYDLVVHFHGMASLQED